MLSLAVAAAAEFPFLLIGERPRWIVAVTALAIGVAVLNRAWVSGNVCVRTRALRAALVAAVFSGVLLATGNVGAFVDGLLHDRNPYRRIIGASGTSPDYVAVACRPRMFLGSDRVIVGEVREFAGLRWMRHARLLEYGPWTSATLRVDGASLRVTLLASDGVRDPVTRELCVPSK